MHEGVGTRDAGLVSEGVQRVARHGFAAGGKPPFPARPHERSHLVPAREKLGNQPASDVAGASRHENR